MSSTPTPSQIEAALAYFRSIDAVGASRRHEHLSVLTEALAERGWRPIESAPRDGTIIWAVESGSHTGLTIPHQHMAKWIETAVYLDGGAWACITDDTRSLPTHWQPLPEPPHDR